MNKLKNLKLTAVALCKQGCNPEAHIMLYKSINEGGKVQMNFEELLKSLPQDQQDLINAELDKAKKEMPADMKANMDAMLEEKKKAEEKATAAEATCKSLQTELDTIKKSNEPNEEEILKSMPENIRKAYEDMKAKTAAQEAIVKVLEEEKVTKAYQEKASVFKSIPAKTEDLATMLKSIGKVDKALVDQVENLLKATDELLAKSVLMGEQGKPGDGGSGDALLQLNKKAEDIAKSEKVSKEVAFSKALKENPELYKAYLNDLE
jgi:GrpB-like predicted nucleotidyltransferase (UPF0157 family)